jgi:polyisoprenoid-binding protein YceI
MTKNQISIESRLIAPIIILMLIIAIRPAGAQNGGNGLYTPTEESRLWIEGKATVNDYSCETSEMEGEAVLQDQANGREVREEAVATLTVPAESLDCGKNRMNKDMYEALKVEEHPYIRFELLSARLVDDPPSERGKKSTMVVTGNLEIAGVSREYQLEVEAYNEGSNRYRAEGSRALNMRDFDITPPTAMLGLIKADENLTVYFDIVVESR